MRIQYTSVTAQGGRKENEDSIRIERDNDRYMFALADGLGSYGNGKTASSIAVDASAECFLSGSTEQNLLERTVRLAQEKVLEKQKEDSELSVMSTTLAVLYLEKNHAQWVHIGDSRVYFFQDDHLKDYTKDHSVPQLMVRLGEIRQDEVRGHPQQNQLLKVVGRAWTERPFSISKEYTLRGSEWFLLCSDGFWEYIVEEQMEQCLRSSDTPEEWLRKMDKMAAVQASGTKRDNYSAICIRISKEEEGERQ